MATAASRPSGGRRRHVFVVSDATGDTCEQVVKAALSQFTATEVILERFPEVRTLEQIEEVITKAAQAHGVVIYTMVAIDLRQQMLHLGLRTGVPTVDIMGPILTRLSEHLELSPLAQPGLFKHLDRAYYARLEAVDFTVKHDDGLGAATLDRAEIILVGVSRTAKTPVSLYLSLRGWRVANVPLIPEMDLPAELFATDQRRIIGFVMQPQHLQTLRFQRQHHLGNRRLGGYADLAAIAEEIRFSKRLFAKHGWPVLDVTSKAIEETSSEVMQVIFTRTGQTHGEIGND